MSENDTCDVCGLPRHEVALFGAWLCPEHRRTVALLWLERADEAIAARTQIDDRAVVREAVAALKKERGTQ